MRYTWRNNNVLQVLYSNIVEATQKWHEYKTLIYADLNENHSTATIPPHILITNKRPDQTIINESERTIQLLELTICWDQSHQAAQNRKFERYQELTAELAEANWKLNLLPIQIGSRGFSANETANNLKSIFTKRKQRSSVLTNLIVTSLSSSHVIFQRKSTTTWTAPAIHLPPPSIWSYMY